MTIKDTRMASMYIGQSEKKPVEKEVYPGLHILDRNEAIVEVLENFSISSIPDDFSPDEEYTQTASMYIGESDEKPRKKYPDGNKLYWNTKHTLDIKTYENTFDFTTLADVSSAQHIVNRNKVVMQDQDGFFRPFLMEQIEQEHQDGKQVKIVHAVGEEYELRTSKVLEPQTLTGATPLSATTTIVSGTRWQVGIVDLADAQDIEIAEYTSALKALQKVAKAFALQLRFRVDMGGNTIGARYVDLVKPDDIFDGKEFTFGKDLTGLRRKEDTSNVCTRLIGISPAEEQGKFVTIESVNNGKNYIESQEAIRRWSVKGLPVYGLFQYQPEGTAKVTPQELYDATNKEMKKRIESVVEYGMSGLLLERITGYEHEKVRAAMNIRIKDEEFNPALYLEAKVIRTEMPALGDPEGDFAFKLGNYHEVDVKANKAIQYLQYLLRGKAAVIEGPTPPTDTKYLWKDTTSPRSRLKHYDAALKEWLSAEDNTASGNVDLPTKALIGYILFDKLQGGTLVLGGLDNKNGILQLKNADGEIIADLDAANGGFTDLFVDNLRSPSIINVNAKTNFTVNLDGGDDSGDDNNLATIGEAINRIGKYNPLDVTINVTGTGPIREYLVKFAGFFGEGQITLDLGGLRLNGELTIHDCHNYIRVQNGTINVSNQVISSENCVIIDNSSYVFLGFNIYIYGNNDKKNAIYVSNGSVAEINDVEMYDTQYGIFASGATVIWNNCRGSVTDYGAFAYRGVVRGDGTLPAGTTATFGSSEGGVIQGSFTADSGVAAPPAPPETTKTFKATSAGSYRPDFGGQWNVNGQIPQQGSYAGYGPYKGLWFFGGSGLDTTLSGKTIIKMKIKITRQGRGGSSGNAPIRLHYHSYSSQPTGTPSLNDEGVVTEVNMEWGETKWVNIPSEWFNNFTTLDAKGIGVYNGSNGYAYMDTDATIEVTYK